MERVPVAIIGGGQSGLAVSHELSGLGVEHVVLERGRVGQSWRDRWDAFCLVTPNWFVQLPGHPYDGDDPDGYMPRDEIVAYFERYAAAVGAPVREGVDVRSVVSANGGFDLETAAGTLHADAVVLATGAYQRPHRPETANSLPGDVLQLDVEDYRSERELPPGAVLIVGSGQSGCQIAEELHEAGRDVVLACGRAPWLPRRFGDRDLVWWLLETGFLDASVDSLPEPTARLWANVLASGHGGGHDLHLRTLRDLGVRLAGHFVGADGHEARFAPDLAQSIAWGDERYELIADLVRKLVQDRGLEYEGLPPPAPFCGRGLERLDFRGVGAVVFTAGFRPDYERWLPWPGAFDDLGFPIHEDGENTVVPGAFFIGVHFLRKRKSALLCGVGEDSAIVARRVADRVLG